MYFRFVMSVCLLPGNKKSGFNHIMKKLMLWHIVNLYLEETLILKICQTRKNLLRIQVDSLILQKMEQMKFWKLHKCTIKLIDSQVFNQFLK